MGPSKMTREDKMNIVMTIVDQLLMKYGEKVKAIGLYGSLARKTDGPYSDIEMKCVLHSLKESFSYEWTAGDWKAEINFDDGESILAEAASVDEEWPLTHGQFFDILPLYDPDSFFQSLKENITSIDSSVFQEVICQTLVEEMYEYMGKIRNIQVQGPDSFLPILAMNLAMGGAMIIGLHHQRCYTTSAQVLPEALTFTDKPKEFASLCEMVMTGNLSNPQHIILVCERFWKSLVSWSTQHGYKMNVSQGIPW